MSLLRSHPPCVLRGDLSLAWILPSGPAWVAIKPQGATSLLIPSPEAEASPYLVVATVLQHLWSKSSGLSVCDGNIILNNVPHPRSSPPAPPSPLPHGLWTFGGAESCTLSSASSSTPNFSATHLLQGRAIVLQLNRYLKSLVLLCFTSPTVLSTITTLMQPLSSRVQHEFRGRPSYYTLTPPLCPAEKIAVSGLVEPSSFLHTHPSPELSSPLTHFNPDGEMDTRQFCFQIPMSLWCSLKPIHLHSLSYLTFHQLSSASSVRGQGSCSPLGNKKIRRRFQQSPVTVSTPVIATTPQPACHC